jgi:hypothetical protein
MVGLVASTLMLLAVIGAGRAEAQQAQFDSSGPGAIIAQNGALVRANGDNTVRTVTLDNPQWYQYMNWFQSKDSYVGPKGFTYRMYQAMGPAYPKCLDVTPGDPTVNAVFLTMAHCEWSRNSQWWAFSPSGKLVPWHAANKNFVAGEIWDGYRMLTPDGDQPWKKFSPYHFYPWIK